MSLSFISRVPHVNQSITKWSHAWEWKLTIGSKDGCISLRWLTNCPLESLVSPPPSAGFSSILIFSYCFSSPVLSFPSAPFSLSFPHTCTASSLHIASRPLPCRSVQAPGGTVNAVAVPDESAGPQLLEQDYWWVLGYGRICEYTQEFEAAGQKITKSCDYFFFFFLQSDTQYNITGNGAVTTWEPKIYPPWTKSSQLLVFSRPTFHASNVKKNYNSREETDNERNSNILAYCLFLFTYIYIVCTADAPDALYELFHCPRTDNLLNNLRHAPDI